MKYDLTLAKIKNTDFAPLYDRFIIGEKLSKKQYEILLAIAICFTNADDINVQQLGYRIVVEYCNQTNDYIPLYEIAVNKGLYPVSKFIEKHYIDDSKRNFFTEWNDAFTEQYVSDHLDTEGVPDPDLLIRTSGEQRISNFLLWQLAYTEFYFTDVPWPDFNRDELVKAIEAYNKRDRRYGNAK